MKFKLLKYIEDIENIDSYLLCTVDKKSNIFSVCGDMQTAELAEVITKVLISDREVHRMVAYRVLHNYLSEFTKDQNKVLDELDEVIH